MEWLAANGDQLSTVGVLLLVAGLVITDKLVWHTRLRQETARGDRWEKVALNALGVAQQLTVHGEVSNQLMSELPTAPDPEPKP